MARSKPLPETTKFCGYAVLACIGLAVITTDPLWLAGAVLAVLVGFAAWALQ